MVPKRSSFQDREKIKTKKNHHQNSYEKATQQSSKAIVEGQQCQDLFPLTSMPRMTPKGRYLVTLPTLIVEVSITSTTQSCSKVLKSCKCSCDPQNFRICDLHLCNTLSHFWNNFFHQKFSSGAHGWFHLDHLMLTSLTTSWAANWRVIRVSHRFDLTSPRKLPLNGGRCLHPHSKKNTGTKSWETSKPCLGRGEPRSFFKMVGCRSLEHHMAWAKMYGLLLWQCPSWCCKKYLSMSILRDSSITIRKSVQKSAPLFAEQENPLLPATLGVLNGRKKLSSNELLLTASVLS